MIDITLLGTAATMPLPERALSSVLIRYDGRTILIDCGEGTQTAARKAKVSLMKTDIIALTHFHGDHIFGLPGLMQSFACLGRTEPLYICGPEGIQVALEPILKMAGPLPYKVFLRLDAETGIPFGEATLQAFKVNHRIPCYGYEFILPRKGKFDASLADALGVRLEDRSKLQHGEPVTVGDKVITADMVIGKPRKGLKVVISGDTAPCDNLTDAAKDADLFICEATYGEDECSEDAKTYGHSTFSQTGKTAQEAGVKMLWMTHFSQMMEQPQEFIQNAQQYYPDAVCGEDGMKTTLKFKEER